MSGFFISKDELKCRIGRPDAPFIYDVRRLEAVQRQPRSIPTATWRDHLKAAEWADEVPHGALVVVHCVHGHNVSQLAAADLRRRDRDARVLQGGLEGWIDAGGLTFQHHALSTRLAGSGISRWVTRIRPKIDRIACPWLIRRFIDRQA